MHYNLLQFQMTEGRTSKFDISMLNDSFSLLFIHFKQGSEFRTPGVVNITFSEFRTPRLRAVPFKKKKRISISD